MSLRRDGPEPAASRLQLPVGAWDTVLDCLCDRFPRIGRAVWTDRFVRGRVLDADGNPLPLDAPYRGGAKIRYFREVADEPSIPYAERILYADAHLVVVDKPPFLPVLPAGRFVRETLLARLVGRLGNPDLVPLHRLDRLTAGLVLFSADPETRDAYHALFRERRIAKAYEALATPLPEVAWPHIRESRIVRGEPFFRMRETEGAPNSRTRIEVLARGRDHWRYALHPLTGRKHQLRLHMAALGAPILGDPLYPALSPDQADDYARPLRLLAKALVFEDPLTGLVRRFESLQDLG